MWNFKQMTEFKPISLGVFALEVIFQIDKVFFTQSYKQLNWQSSNQ